jgi:hypothetical protein
LPWRWHIQLRFLQEWRPWPPISMTIYWLGKSRLDGTKPGREDEVENFRWSTEHWKVRATRARCRSKVSVATISGFHEMFPPCIQVYFRFISFILFICLDWLWHYYALEKPHQIPCNDSHD